MVNLLCVNLHTTLTLGCLPIPDSALTIKGFFIFFQEIKDSQSGIIGALKIIKKHLTIKMRDDRKIQLILSRLEYFVQTKLFTSAAI